jgi:uroporphyrinogen III methyltransferase/synthase
MRGQLQSSKERPHLSLVPPLQGLLDEAPAGAELIYVGKRGGQPSTKQPEIDKLLVQLCQQVLLPISGCLSEHFLRVMGRLS